MTAFPSNPEELKDQLQEAYDHPSQGNGQAPRPRTIEVVLDGQTLTVKRLGTRDGLAVAHAILKQISRLRGPLETSVAEVQALQAEGEEERDKTQDYIRIGLEILEVLMQQLEENELLRLISRLLGQPEALVGDAPLEDVMNAVADAMSINDLPALIKAASRIGQEAQRIGAGL